MTSFVTRYTALEDAGSSTSAWTMKMPRKAGQGFLDPRILYVYTLPVPKGLCDLLSEPQTHLNLHSPV